MIDKTLLATESLLRKGMREKLSLTLMIFVVGGNQIRSRTLLSIGPKIFLKDLSTGCLVPVNVFVGVGSDEGDIVGGVSNDRAVLVVQVRKTIHPLASGYIPEVWELSCGVELRAWDFREGVEEDIVNGADCRIESQCCSENC